MSLDEEAQCVGKIGDFGLAQTVAPYCVIQLGNCDETAPETWGDTFQLKQATAYTEKSGLKSYHHQKHLPTHKQ